MSAADATRAYHVYWIQSGAHRAYIGATVDPARRLRQHNGELRGGALRTRNAPDAWAFRCIVHGFRTWRESLQFEWAFKYYSRRCRGPASRERVLAELMRRERWTSNAPLAADVPLTVEWFDVGAVADGTRVSAAAPVASPARRGGARRRRYATRLHGVTY